MQVQDRHTREAGKVWSAAPAGPAERLLAVLAPTSLCVGLPPVWSAVVGRGWPALTMAVSCALPVLIALVVAALCVRTTSRLGTVNLAVLALGLALQGAAFAATHSAGYGTDEARLNRMALFDVVHNRNPYLDHLPAALSGTPLLGGGYVETYGYPPFEAELGRALSLVSPAWVTPAVIGFLGLCALAVVTFVVLPQALRPLAVVSVLGFDILPPLAHGGYAILLALPFLVLALWRWRDIGTGGRLGARGTAQAACLGIACSAQQFAWIAAVFLLVAIAAQCRRAFGTRVGLLLVSRFVSVVIAVFVVLDLPFIVLSPSVWAHRLLSVFTQQAIVFGEGPGSAIVTALHGSGGLGLLTPATILLLIGLIAALVLWTDRLAPAVMVFASLTFSVNARSPVDYFLFFVPLWMVSAAWAALPYQRRDASPPELPERDPTLPRRIWYLRAAVAVPLASAIALLVAAFLIRPPLSLRVTTRELRHGHLSGIVVQVVNTGSTPLRPVFLVGPREAVRSEWDASGPGVLPPDGTGEYRLVPPVNTAGPPLGPDLYLYATTGRPAGIAVVHLADNGT